MEVKGYAILEILHVFTPIFTGFINQYSVQTTMKCPKKEGWV